MKTYCFAGSWGQKEGPFGITTYEYLEDGTMKRLSSAAEDISVGCMKTCGDVLYCTHERADLEGFRLGGGGMVLAFSIDPVSGELREISRAPSYAAMATYVVPNGRFLAVANHATRTNHITISERGQDGKLRIRVLYDDSSLALFRRNHDGSIGDVVDVLRMQGDGPVDGIQNSPHLHSVQCSPDGSYYCICDKGSDKIHFVRLNGDRLEITNSFSTGAGFAPRYSVFDREKPFLFVNNELQPYVYSIRIEDDGSMSEICCVPSLPEGIGNPEGFGQSDLKLSGDGRFLYCLFRGVEAIAVFRVDRETGKLTRVQFFETGEKTPRGCEFTPDGKSLVVAFIGSNHICSYPIREDGTLTQATAIQEHHAVGCVWFHTVK